MISCLFFLMHCLFAGSYECNHYTKVNDPSRSVSNTVFNSDKRHNCDTWSNYENGWYRFTAAGNEMIPLTIIQASFAAKYRCGTHGTGRQMYSQPTRLYDTTS